MSNMAEGEWCAHKAVVARRIISAARTPQIFCLTVILLWELMASLSLRYLYTKRHLLILSERRPAYYLIFQRSLSFGDAAAAQGTVDVAQALMAGFFPLLVSECSRRIFLLEKFSFHIETERPGRIHRRIVEHR